MNSQLAQYMVPLFLAFAPLGCTKESKLEKTVSQEKKVTWILPANCTEGPNENAEFLNGLVRTADCQGGMWGKSDYDGRGASIGLIKLDPDELPTLKDYEHLRTVDLSVYSSSDIH